MLKKTALFSRDGIPNSHYTSTFTFFSHLLSLWLIVPGLFLFFLFSDFYFCFITYSRFGFRSAHPAGWAESISGIGLCFCLTGYVRHHFEDDHYL